MQAEQIEINGDIFTFSTYNGLNVIVAPTGYINATNLCKQCGKDFRHYKENQEWTEIINYFEKQQPSEFRRLVGPAEYRIHSGIPDKYKFLRGTYVHPDLIHFVAHWCSIEYAFKVSKVMNLINERANITETPSNENLNLVIEQLKKENEELKRNINENRHTIDQYGRTINEQADEIYTQSVRSNVNTRKLTFLLDDEGRIKMSADNQRKFPHFIIRYEFPASMNIRMMLKRELRIKSISNIPLPDYERIINWLDTLNPKSRIEGDQ